MEALTQHYQTTLLNQTFEDCGRRCMYFLPAHEGSPPTVGEIRNACKAPNLYDDFLDPLAIIRVLCEARNIDVGIISSNELEPLMSIIQEMIVIISILY